MILAIDPGVAGEGCAVGVAHPHSGAIEDVWFERPRPLDGAVRATLTRHAQRVTQVLVERPVYQGERSENARTQDLLDISWDGAMLAGMYAGRDQCPIVELPPSDTTDARCPVHGGKKYRKREAGLEDCTCQRGWKGSEPKPLMHGRMWDVLTKRERGMLGGASTARMIESAIEKGGLSRWSKAGVDYYPKSWTMHNKLDVACMIGVYTNRVQRVG